MGYIRTEQGYFSPTDFYLIAFQNKKAMKNIHYDLVIKKP